MRVQFLVFCIFVGSTQSLTVTDERAKDVSSRVYMINNGGPVMKTPNVYVIFVGATWTQTQKNLVADFLTNIGTHPWWKINEGYGVGRLTFGGYISVPNVANVLYTQKDLPGFIRSQVQPYLPNGDPNGIFLVLISSDVQFEGFCSGICGFHGYDQSTGLVYGLAGTPSAKCGYACFGGHNVATSPNGQPAVDALINTVAHELAEAATDPRVNFQTAWASNDRRECADICQNTFLGVLTDPVSRSFYNLQVGTKRYLIQSNFNLKTNTCTNA